MVTNRRLVEDDGQDFYPTPTWCIEALLDVEDFEGYIWEPACGDGAISEVLKEHGYNVFSSDLYDHGYTNCYGDTWNFLDQINDENFLFSDNIITNPPYNIVNEFTLKALELSRGKVALLVRLAYLEGQERYQTIFEQYPPSTIWVFSERITMYKKYAEDKKGSGTTAYMWIVWDKNDTKGYTEIKWLKPGYKK